MSKQMLELAEELREYTAMKYAGDCKCGKCQLVPRRLVERIYHALNSTAIRSSAVSVGCGDPNCSDPNCEYGKGPARCQSCGAIIGAEPQASVMRSAAARWLDKPEVKAALHRRPSGTEPQKAGTEAAVEDVIGDMTAAWVEKKWHQAFRQDCEHLVAAVRSQADSSPQAAPPSLADLPAYLDYLEQSLVDLDIDLKLPENMLQPGIWADRVRAAFRSHAGGI